MTDETRGRALKPCYVYGAQAIAYGIARALEKQGEQVAGFVVTDMEGNPSSLGGKQVIPVDKLGEARIYVAVPEYLHPEIIEILKGRGLRGYICVDAELEYRLMKSLFQAERRLKFPEDFERPVGEEAACPQADFAVYVAKSLHDKPLQSQVSFPAGSVTVQAGTALGEFMETDFHDNEGENISDKNGCYDELTVTYWAWKNSRAAVKGIAHYRRCLMVTEAEKEALLHGGLDVLLPMPFLCWPDTSMQYGRYNTSKAVEAMLEALSMLYGSKERERAVKVLRGEIIYNYNMLIARQEAFDAYCSWMFPVLEQVEKICAPEIKAVQHSRICGHLGELLLTIYMLTHGHNLKIAHGKKKWFP